MGILRSARSAFNRLLCARREIEGVAVYLFPEQEERVDDAWAKVTESLGLIARHSPRQLARMHRLVEYVLIHDTMWDYVGLWDSRSRAIELNWKYLLRPEAEAAHVGASIVHEATHAWLNDLGFTYRPDRRQRIEAVCVRAEAAFARRIAGGAPLAEYYEARATEIVSNGDYWTDAAFSDRRRSALDHAEGRLRELGTPDVIMKAVRKLWRRGSA